VRQDLLAPDPKPNSGAFIGHRFWLLRSSSFPSAAQSQLKRRGSAAGHLPRHFPSSTPFRSQSPNASGSSRSWRVEAVALGALCWRCCPGLAWWQGGGQEPSQQVLESSVFNERY